MIQEIVAYKKILGDVEMLMNETPYKKAYIIESVGIPAPTFYRKLKSQAFTVDEMLKLAKLLAPEEYYIQELKESLAKADDDYINGRVKKHEDVMEVIKRDYLK